MNEQEKMIASGVLGVIVIAGLAAPYFVGQRIETRLQAAVSRQADEQGAPIRLTEYDRGWFSSEATLHAGTAPEDAVLHLAITHGPWHPLGWARVQVTPTRLGNANAMAHYFDGPAFVAHITSGFGGDVHGMLESPAFDKPLQGSADGHVVWGGANASYDENDDHELSVDYRWTVPEAHWQTSEPAGRPVDARQAEVELRLAGFQAKPMAALFRDLRSLPGPRPGSEASSDQHKPQTLATDERIEQLMMSYLPKVLAKTPSLTLKVPHVELSTGGFKAQATAKLQPAGAVPALQANPSVPPITALMLRLQVDVSVYVDKPLIAHFTDASDRPQQSRQLVSAYLQQGLLEAKDDALGARLHYQAGQATLNDQPLPPGLIGALAQGLPSQ